MYSHLFSPFEIKGLKLKNRLTMAPLYLGYASEKGTVTDLLLEHYQLMAQSGVALVVVENASIEHPSGSNFSRNLRADTEDNLDGLRQLCATIKREGALACLQINHAGRFAAVPGQPLAPSVFETFGRVTKALNKKQIKKIVEKFAAAALIVKKAGFDMVELHGGTGYLLSEFVSPWTNRRADEYGGTLENRMRFALEVVDAVKTAVGNLPIGYRFLADEWLPHGLRLEESSKLARALSDAGIAYISVMGGTHESFHLPENIEKAKKDGYMVELAASIKKQVGVPVITAGRISTGIMAERIIRQGEADLIGLARVLWADPQWPKKVKEGNENEICHCDPECDTCTTLLMKDKQPFCVRWPQKKRLFWKEKLK